MLQYVVIHNTYGSHTGLLDFFKKEEWKTYEDRFAYNRPIPTEKVLRLIGIDKYTYDNPFYEGEDKTMVKDTILVLDDLETGKVYLFSTEQFDNFSIFNHVPEKIVRWE